MAIMLLAIATGQKVGQNSKRQNNNSPLGARFIDRSADRGLNGKSEQAADSRHQSDFGLAPLLLGD
jgi:hypothetical protein